MNNLSGLFQTLVAATSRAAENLRYANSFVDAIYWDFKPVVATPNTSLSVIIPSVNEGDVTDIGSGALNPTDTDHDQVSVPYDKHFSTSFVIKAWDQARTPQDLERTYIKPRLESLLRAVNKTIALQLTDANFGTGATPIAGYALATGTTSQSFERADISPNWAKLVDAGVPVDDEGNVFFITSPTGYGNMLGDQTMSYSYIVTEDVAKSVQQRAKLKMILGAEPRYDQHLGQIATTTLGYTSGRIPAVLMHRYALAAVTAQPPPTDQAQAQIQEQIIWLKDVLPVQVQIGYSLKDQGYIVHLHAFWGIKTARPNFAIRIQSAA